MSHPKIPSADGSEDVSRVERLSRIEIKVPPAHVRVQGRKVKQRQDSE